MRNFPYAVDGTVPPYLQQDSSFCPSGPSGDQSQSALNCVIFTANALGVARCRADQMAAEDLRELHHASQQLRLYTVQATDQFSRQDHNNHRDNIQSHLHELSESNNLSNIFKVAQVLYADLPLFTCTVVSATVCCDGLAHSAHEDFNPQRLTVLVLSVDDWRRSAGGGIQGVLQRKFGSILRKTKIQCTLRDRCQLRRGTGFVILDRLYPVLYLVLSHPVGCDAAKDAGFFSTISISTWTSTDNANACAQGDGGDCLMTQTHVELYRTAAWFVTEAGDLFVRVRKGTQISQFNSCTGAISQHFDEWVPDCHSSSGRVIALFLTQEESTTP